jgi:sugar (pentulose or hexulose) kinase
MNEEQAKHDIIQGRTALGIEFGSTRIKAVLIDSSHAPVASSGYDWENKLEDGLWTYQWADVWTGLTESFKKLTDDVKSRYGIELKTAGAIGISAMMHGYIALGCDGEPLVPFRTWRNTTTERAAALLTEKFGFNIPLRWSVAHLYQAMLNGESHVRDVTFLTTLAGYVHWKLTGRKVLGIGDASGMFPIDSKTNDYHAGMIAKFAEIAEEFKFGRNLTDILPEVQTAGDDAGELTEEGARLLDPSGRLEPGIPFCPPEGDAGTGMVATNSVAERTGNVSAGTSIFAMIVLERDLSKIYTEIDMVTTPAGKPVAMVHCNNCTSDIDAWIRLFGEAVAMFGNEVSKRELYDAMYAKALDGETDGGGVLSYNYYAGEPITGLDEGRPLLVRSPDGRFTLANLMRSALYSAMGTLKIGMDILTEKERVHLDKLLGHGGFFKARGVGQKLMASALGVPVAVMESAGEGGAWGIALLAAYNKRRTAGETLESYLSDKVFDKIFSESAEPDADGAKGFAAYMERYAQGLAVERAAVAHLKY